MKNKFKLFCTFMICLIFLTLVNTNSPQPSADSTGTGGDVQPQVISIQLIPADNVRLIPPNGKSWMQYLKNIQGKKFTIVYKFKMPTDNIKISDYCFKLFGSTSVVENPDYSTNAKHYTNSNSSPGDNTSSAQDNGYVGTVTWPISDITGLDEKYNLGNSVAGYLKGTYGSDQSFDLAFSNNPTRSNLFTSTLSENPFNQTSQTYNVASPIIVNTKLTGKYRGYDLMQRCYNHNLTGSSLVDQKTYNDITDNNSDAFKTKEYVGDPDRTYSTEETNKPKVLVVDPTNGNPVVKKWFDPRDMRYNNNYKLDIFAPVNFHDLSSNSLPGSPLFN